MLKSRAVPPSRYGNTASVLHLPVHLPTPTYMCNSTVRRRHHPPPPPPPPAAAAKCTSCYQHPLSSTTLKFAALTIPRHHPRRRRRSRLHLLLPTPAPLYCSTPSPSLTSLTKPPASVEGLPDVARHVMTKCVKPLLHLKRRSAKSSRSTNHNAPSGRLRTTCC